MISENLLQVPEIAKAIELTKQSAYTKEELEAYDRYWDVIRTQRTFIADAEAKGKNEGKIERQIEGILRGFDNKVSLESLCLVFNLSKQEIEVILRDNNRI